jgi:hypothetical protein
MTTHLDPYYKWLAIPPEEQPPNHYRLLGVPLFTDDPDVIEYAADQRMAHVRGFQIGKFAELSQKILNEVAIARICLLNPKKKREYDQDLRAKLGQSAVPSSPPPPSPAPDIQETQTIGSPIVRAAPQRKGRSGKSVELELAKHVGASLAGLAIGYVLLCWIAPRYDVLGIFSKQPVAARPVAEASPPEVEKISTGPSKQPIASPPAEDRVTPVIPPNTSPKAEHTQEAQGNSVGERPDQASVDSPIGDVPANNAEQPSDQLAALTKRRDDAINSGDIAVAVQLTEEIALVAENDVIEAKADVLGQFEEFVERGPQSAELGAALMDLAIAAQDAGRNELARQKAASALRFARESGNHDLVRRLTKLVLSLEK